ncbi:SPRY domain-containing protein [Variovorax paradoxus]|uniref:B30.2/SPRY domain-containing protein n=1 Tax=Variovorax paradoxus TaxID=34073 RepID=A0A679JB27_VARPD|nr:hypothetical protein VVAX_04063 [Variovorax paradoxus]
MAAHRYWRAIGLESYGEALELTEFHLLGAGVRVDAPAVLTSSIAPAAGSPANLKDDNLSTGASWTGASVAALVLSWDFGAGGSADVTDIRLGSAVDAAKFLLAGKLQYSDDATTWVDAWTPFAGVAWPGPRAKTTSEAIGGWLRGFKNDVDLSAGGSIATLKTASGVSPRVATAGRTAGVLQVEFEWLNVSLTGATTAVGVMGAASLPTSGATVVGNALDSWAYTNTGTRRTNSVGVAYGASYTLADVIGMVVDFAAGSITFYKNGVSQGVAYSGLSFAELFAAAQMYNFGQNWQVRIRTKGFIYPVAGATPWEERDSAITQNALRGKTRAAAVAVAPTPTTVPVDFGNMRLSPVYQARGDYLTGVIGRGTGRVRGFTLDYVNPLNKPYRCRVRLVRESDGLQLREAWSAADGSYDFQYVDELQSYTVIAYYEAHGKRAVVTDGLTLANGKVELMA